MKLRPMLALAAVAASTVAMLTASPASAIVCPVGTRPVTVYHPLTGRPIGSVCVPYLPPMCEEICLAES